MEQAYKELLKKYNSLLEENRRLKTELALLKGEDGLSMPESETATDFRHRQLTNTVHQKRKSTCSVHFSKAEKMFLPVVGTAKLWIKTVISLFVKTNGMRSFATRKSLSALPVPIVSL